MPEVPNSKGMRAYALKVCLVPLTPFLYLTTQLPSIEATANATFFSFLLEGF